ncbi:MAG: serine/threonine-protein kinase [Planctomycetota bacterium]|nr:serine/threonine-protein kinase [Planctomycetota bacterium]
MAHPEDKLLGRILGGYRIDELLSSGPMGKVYKAFQLSVERYVALKFLATPLLDKKAVTDAFVEGAKEAASLNHRNIVRVHDVCREEGYLFYSMEYVGGGSFRDRIGKGPLSVSAWPRMLRDVSSGLLYAQEKGVFHPQLIPEHFLLSEAKEVKILNLGFASSMEPVRKKLGVRFADWVFYSDPNDPEGTPGNRRGEVFTAGCSLYHVMSGGTPFQGETVEQVTALKSRRDAPPLEQKALMAAPWLSAIVGRMIDRDLEVRYRDFSELNEEVGLHCAPEAEGRRLGRKIPILASALLVLAVAGYLLVGGGEGAGPAGSGKGGADGVAKVEPGSGPGSEVKVSPVDDSVPGTVPATEAPGEPSTAEGGVARRETELEPRVEKVPAESTGEGPPLSFVEVVKRGDSWRFFPGRIAPEADWNKPDFDDSSWAAGPSGFGYSSMGSELVTLKTRLDDMPTEKYLSVYIRKSFEIEELARLREFRLKLLIDDGFVAYLNGTEVARYSMEGSAPAFDQEATEQLDPDNGEERAFDLGKYIPLLRPGRNVFAIQGHNHTVDSSDFVLTPSLEILSFRRQLTDKERAELKLEYRVKDVPAWSLGKGPSLDFAQVVKRGDSWRYFPGRIAPEADWNKPDFDDSGWSAGPSGFGYSPEDNELKTLKTRLDDMPTDEYLSLYIRKSFQFEELVRVQKFRLKLLVDDGFVAYLNGVEVARYNMTGRSPAFDQEAGIKVEVDDVGEMSFDLEKHIPLLRRGRNVLAIQGHNRSLTSSDFVLTPMLEILTLRSQLSASELADLELELSMKAEEQVGGYLKLRDYRGALDSVRDLEFRFKGHQELEDWKKKVLAGLESDLEVTLMRAENLLELGDFVKTRELIEDVNSRIPRGYEKRTQSILDAVAVGEGIVEGAEETIARAEVAVLVAIEKGDYKEAEKVLEGIPEVPVKTLREGIGRVKMAVELSRWAWGKMLLGLRKYRGKRELLVAVEPAGEDGVVPPWWLHSYKKSEGEEVSVVLHRKGGAPRQCDLLDLPLPALLGFFQAGKDRIQPGEVDVIAERYGAGAGAVGIEMLILCRKGPKAAWDALGGVPEKDRGGLQEGITYLGKLLLQSSLTQAEVFAQFATSDDGDAAAEEKVDWEVYLQSVREIVRRHRTLPYFKESREKILGFYTMAANKHLEVLSLQGLVAGKLKGRNLAKKKGVVQLSYDFSSQDQLADFIVMDGSARIEQGHLVLSGECRLLHGSPFRNAIEVKLIATAYAATSPSINIALWTREGEKVTTLLPSKENEITEENAKYGISEDGKDMPNDYLAFCLGYDMGTDHFMEVGNSKPASNAPAFAITAGVRGVTLHMAHGDGTYYTYWTESVGGRIKGRQNVTLGLSPKGLLWTCNSLKLHRMAQRKKPELLKWLLRPEASGSITLFTNGRENRYDFLNIEAELDPDWIGKERKRKIEKDFAALEAGN